MMAEGSEIVELHCRGPMKFTSAGEHSIISGLKVAAGGISNLAQSLY